MTITEGIVTLVSLFFVSALFILPLVMVLWGLGISIPSLAIASGIWLMVAPIIAFGGLRILDVPFHIDRNGGED